MARARMEATRDGKLPWVATLTPAELMMARSRGFRPIAAISATCWMHYGWSWTQGHAQGWETALARLRREAKAAGANAVLDVKMRTIPLEISNSMDFTLVGTAVRVEGLPPSVDPVVATLPAVEFLRLLEADIVTTGIAIGAQYDFLPHWLGTTRTWGGNVECTELSQFWETIRQRAHAELRRSASTQGNGVLAHINFGQLFEVPESNNQPKRFLGRQIVIATTVDTPLSTKRVSTPWGDQPWVGPSGAAPRKAPALPHEIAMLIDLHAGKTKLTGRAGHHQSYATNEEDGAI